MLEKASHKLHGIQCHGAPPIAVGFAVAKKDGVLFDFHNALEMATLKRAFRSLKSIDLKIRPIHHRLVERVKAHVFLCMLAYYVEWHMRKALVSILFDDHDPDDAAKSRPSMVAPAERSTAAKRKAASKATDDGLPVHSFQTLLADLVTIARNTVEVNPTGKAPLTFEKITRPTRVQQRALDLLGVELIL